MQKVITTAATIAILFAAPAVFAQSIVPTGSGNTGLTGTVVGAGPGTPGYGSASTATQGAAVLGASLAVAPNAAAGNPNAVLALVQLDGRASSGGIAVMSIPLTFAFTGTIPAQYTSCALRNVNNVNVPLNTGAYAVTALSPTSALFRFDSPIMVPAGGVIDLALTCAIAPNAQPGSIQIGLNPGTVAAADQNGAPVTPIPGPGPTGTTSSAQYGVVTITPASPTGTGTTTGPGVPNTGASGSTSGAPGVPNTGAGGNAPMNEMALALSAIVAVFGAYALARRTVLQ